VGACGTAWLDGRFLPLSEARISPLDRGFLFGDAAYEVVPVYDGRLYRLREHLDRLDRSLRELRIAQPLSREGWHRVCGGLVARNGAGHLLVYLQVSRGVEAGRQHVPSPATTPTVFGMASELAPLPPDPAARATAAITTADNRWGRCDIKSTALLANVLLKWQAEELGASEAILLRDGHVTEGSSSSVHVVLDGTLVTPPQTHEVLPGTTRDVLLELAPRCGIRCETRTVPEDALHGAQEVILGSAGGGLRAVTSLDGHPVGDGHPGPRFSALYRAWIASLAEFCTECPE
jgi:D-alanine transaminase